MPVKVIIALGAVFSALSVTLGAMGAHSLEGFLEKTGRTATYNTASQYLFYHSLSLVLIGILGYVSSEPRFQYAAYLHIAGLFLFSGSLYLICFTQQTWFGAIAPIGGLAFIAGWILLAYYGFQLK